MKAFLIVSAVFSISVMVNAADKSSNSDKYNDDLNNAIAGHMAETACGFQTPLSESEKDAGMALASDNKKYATNIQKTVLFPKSDRNALNKCRKYFDACFPDANPYIGNAPWDKASPDLGNMTWCEWATLKPTNCTRPLTSKVLKFISDDSNLRGDKKILRKYFNFYSPACNPQSDQGAGSSGSSHSTKQAN